MRIPTSARPGADIKATMPQGCGKGPKDTAQNSAVKPHFPLPILYLASIASVATDASGRLRRPCSPGDPDPIGEAA
jgi:hypothetical protein